MQLPVTIFESSDAASGLSLAPSSGLVAKPGWFATAPSWLISAVAHLTALNVLALWCATDNLPRHPSLVITVHARDATSANAEDITLEDLPDELPTPEPVALESAMRSAAEEADAVILAVERIVERELYEHEFATPSFARVASSQTASIARNGPAVPRKASVPDGAVQFYGIEARGNSFVFIVDSSRSMIGPKFESAKQELLYAVQQLSVRQRFYVIFFDGTTRRMSFQESGAPEREPVPATRENIAKLAEWVANVPNGPWTNPAMSVQFALDMRPDAVFLLTDGDFTDRGATLNVLKKRNRGAEGSPIPFHTICLQSRKGEPTLKNIAKSYGGTYRYVSTGAGE